MLRSDADAPKPPAYPFISNQSQRAIVRQKTCDPPEPWRIPSRLVFRFSGTFFRLPPSVRSVTVASLLRWRGIYEGGAAPARGKSAIFAKFLPESETTAKSGGWRKKRHKARERTAIILPPGHAIQGSGWVRRRPDAAGPAWARGGWPTAPAKARLRPALRWYRPSTAA